MLKQETVPIMNKRCCDNVNVLMCFLLGCVPEKRDFSASSILQQLFLQTLFVFYCPWNLLRLSCVLRNRTVNSCIIQSSPIICRHIKALHTHTHTHTHTHIAFIKQGKKKDNITTSCVSACKFDSHEHITHEA